MGSYLSPEEIAYQLTNISDDRRTDIVASTIVLAVLATVAVILRLFCRRFTKIALSWDDYLIIIGLVFLFALTFCAGYSVRFGSGKHALASDLANIETYTKILYAYQIFWAITMAFIKVSILLFYRRLFPSTATTKTWRMCDLALIIFTIAVCIVAVFGSSFACIPVAYIWNPIANDGHCINLIGFARFTSITGLVTDILILILPIPIVWNLQMEQSKKIAVTGVFLLGSFVCVASAIRFSYLEQISRWDPTWGNVNSLIWTNVESSVGIICACLPIMAPILRNKVAAIASSVFRSKKSPQGSKTFAGSDTANPLKENEGFSRLGGTDLLKDADSSRQGSDGDGDVEKGSQGQLRHPEQKDEGNPSVHGISLGDH